MIAHIARFIYPNETTGLPVEYDLSIYKPAVSKKLFTAQKAGKHMQVWVFDRESGTCEVQFYSSYLTFFIN